MKTDMVCIVKCPHVTTTPTPTPISLVCSSFQPQAKQQQGLKKCDVMYMYVHPMYDAGMLAGRMKVKT